MSSENMVYSHHLQNIFESGELNRDRTVKKYLTVQTEGLKTVERQG